MKNKLFLISFILGLLLLMTNLIGLVIPLENKNIYHQKAGFKNDITLTKKEAFAIINQPITNVPNYVIAVNGAINKRILHYWNGAHDKNYHIILPFYENYILYFLTHTFYRQSALRYEFCNYKKTIDRGVGFCSQASTALTDLLNKKGIHTNVIAWPQHVITEVEVSKNNWWVVDPDYGVIIKHSIQYVNKHPESIAPFYQKKVTLKKLLLI